MMRHSFFYTKKSAKTVSILLFFALTILICQKSTASENYLTERRAYLVRTIQRHIYNDNYTQAYQIADSLLAIDADDPLGYLFQAAVYLGEMTNAEQNLFPISFNQMIDTTIMIGQQNILHVDSTTAAWNFLAIGHAHAYRSLYESRFGSLTSALKHGFSAKSAYHDGLKYDSTVYDLYGGLGMYHYWKTVKAGFLRWVGIFKDDKQKGIEELYLTIDSSEVSADAAWSSLIWISLEEKQFDTATTIATKMYQKYPEGTTFLWALGKIYFQSKQYDKSIEVFSLLYDKLMVTRTNYFNIIECEFYIYQAYKILGEEVLAKETAKRFMYYVNDAPMEIRKKQKDKIKKLVKAATN